MKHYEIILVSKNGVTKEIVGAPDKDWSLVTYYITNEYHLDEVISIGVRLTKKPLTISEENPNGVVLS